MRGFYINETDTVFLFTSFSFNKGRRRVAAGRAFDNNWMIDNTTYSGNMTSACNCPNLKTQNPSNAYMVRKYKLVISFLNSNSHPFGFFSLLNVDWEDGCCCYCAISCLFPEADIFKVTWLMETPALLPPSTTTTAGSHDCRWDGCTSKLTDVGGASSFSNNDGHSSKGSDKEDFTVSLLIYLPVLLFHFWYLLTLDVTEELMTISLLVFSCLHPSVSVLFQNTPCFS